MIGLQLWRGLVVLHRLHPDFFSAPMTRLHARRTSRDGRKINPYSAEYYRRIDATPFIPARPLM